MTTVRSLRGDVAALLARAEELLGDQMRRDAFDRSARARLNDWAARPDREAAIDVTGDLDDVALWDANRAAVLLLRGESEGWVPLERALRFRTWSSRLLVAYHSNRPHRHGWQGVGGIFDPAMLAAWHRWWRAHVLADELLAELKRGKESIYQPREPMTAGGWFVVGMQVWSGDDVIELNDFADVAGPFLPLLEHLFTGAPLSQAAFDDACEYHLEKALDERDGEFRFVPWDLLPVELLSYTRICEKRGIGAPELRHPIVTTPVCAPHVLGDTPEELRELEVAIQAVCRELAAEHTPDAST